MLSTAELYAAGQVGLPGQGPFMTIVLTLDGGRITDAFGQLFYQVNDQNDFFRFGGNFGYFTPFYEDTPVIYVRQRWYDPQYFQWINRDLSGFAGGDWNLYRYVENNPVGRADPSGTSLSYGGGGTRALPSLSASLAGSSGSGSSGICGIPGKGPVEGFTPAECRAACVADGNNSLLCNDVCSKITKEAGDNCDETFGLCTQFPDPESAICVNIYNALCTGRS